MFLDWQFNSYVSKQMQPEFKEELLGLRDGGYSTGNYAIYRYVQRVLVVSSYPGDVGSNIEHALLDEFIRAFTPKLRSKGVYSVLTSNKPHYLDWSSGYMKEKRIQCSFFAVWGNRTVDGKVFT